LVQCKPSIDVQMIAHTTIAKLLLRASNKVNSARSYESATAFRDALTRYVDNIRAEIDTKRGPLMQASQSEDDAPGDNVCSDCAHNVSMITQQGH
jgi:hypothetical protein